MGSTAKQISRRVGLMAVLAGICFGVVREPFAVTAGVAANRLDASVSKSPDHDRPPLQDSEAPLPFEEQNGPFEEENGVGSIWDADDGIDRHDQHPPLGYKPLKASVLCHWGACHLSTPRELLYSLQNLRI